MAFKFFDMLMDPLGKQHCNVYYILGILAFFYGIFSIILAMILMFDKKTRSQGLIMVINSITIFFTYYLYRIGYSICIKTL